MSHVARSQGISSDRQPFPDWWRGQDGLWYPQEADVPENERFGSRPPSRLRTWAIVMALGAVVAICLVGMVAYVNTAEPTGSIYRVVGAGKSCSGACPPEVAVYTLRLVPVDGSPAEAVDYNLADHVEQHDGLSGYPECIFAVIGADDIQRWEPSSC